MLLAGIICPHFSYSGPDNDDPTLCQGHDGRVDDVKLGVFMGNKEQEKEKRRRKAAQRRATKRKDKTANARQTKPKGFANVTLEEFPDEQLIWWLANGVNYLVSDYENGVWSPLVEGIYEGKVPSAEELARLVMARFADEKEWPIEAKAAVAWSVSDRNVVYIYYREVLRRLRTTYPDVDDIEALARQPHQPQVWQVFKFLRDKLLKKGVGR